MTEKKKPVRVIWRDIAAISSDENSAAWFTKDELVKEAQALFNAQYTSVGYIVAETEEWVAIAATWDESKDTLYSDASMIMKSVIVSVEEL